MNDKGKTTCTEGGWAQMTDYELIEKMQVMEADHTPDGWPAVRMDDITRLTKLAIHGLEFDGIIDHVTASPDYEGTVSGDGYVMMGAGYYRKLTAQNERYHALLQGIDEMLKHYGR